MEYIKQNHSVVNFEEIDTECATGKNYEFWVLWRIFMECIKQNHSVVICGWIKKSIM